MSKMILKDAPYFFNYAKMQILLSNDCEILNVLGVGN